MKTENTGQATNPELFGRALLAFTVAADPVLRLCELLNVHKLLEAIYMDQSSFNDQFTGYLKLEATRLAE